MKSLLVLATVLLSGVAQAAPGLQIDGFGSTYFGQASGDILPAGFTNKQPAFAPFSLIGLNLYSKLDSNFSVGAQFLATGATAGTPTVAVRDSGGSTANVPSERPFNLNAEWAFISWDATPDFSVRMGRLLAPNWIAAEYLNVGYLLPYRNLPRAVYSLSPISSFDGANVSKSFDMGGMRFVTSIFGGTPVLSSVGIELSNYYGASFGFEGQGWSVKVTGTAATIRLPAANVGANARTVFAGYKIDMANIVSWGEVAYSSADSGADTGVLPTGEKVLEGGGGGYVLVGYRIGKFLPRYTYAESYSKSGLAANTKIKTNIVGVNYEVSNQVAVKAEYEMVEVPSNYSPGGGATRVKAGEEKGNAMYAGVDFTF